MARNRDDIEAPHDREQAITETIGSRVDITGIIPTQIALRGLLAFSTPPDRPTAVISG